MLLGTHILTIVGQLVQQFATMNLCLYIETDIVPTILDYVLLIAKLEYSDPLWDLSFLRGVDPTSQIKNGDSASVVVLLSRRLSGFRT